jgi:Na+-driven multidrug efflux pump
LVVFFKGVAGNIYIGQLLGSNSSEKAKNATKVVFLISGNIKSEINQIFL